MEHLVQTFGGLEDAQTVRIHTEVPGACSKRAEKEMQRGASEHKRPKKFSGRHVKRWIWDDRSETIRKD